MLSNPIYESCILQVTFSIKRLKILEFYYLLIEVHEGHYIVQTIEIQYAVI